MDSAHPGLFRSLHERRQKFKTISIGDQTCRWNALRIAKGLKSNRDVAKTVLDFWYAHQHSSTSNNCSSKDNHLACNGNNPIHDSRKVDQTPTRPQQTLHGNVSIRTNANPVDTSFAVTATLDMTKLVHRVPTNYEDDKVKSCTITTIVPNNLGSTETSGVVAYADEISKCTGLARNQLFANPTIPMDASDDDKSNGEISKGIQLKKEIEDKISKNVSNTCKPIQIGNFHPDNKPVILNVSSSLDGCINVNHCEPLVMEIGCSDLNLNSSVSNPHNAVTFKHKRPISKRVARRVPRYLKVKMDKGSTKPSRTIDPLKTAAGTDRKREPRFPDWTVVDKARDLIDIIVPPANSKTIKLLYQQRKQMEAQLNGVNSLEENTKASDGAAEKSSQNFSGQCNTEFISVTETQGELVIGDNEKSLNCGSVLENVNSHIEDSVDGTDASDVHKTKAVSESEEQGSNELYQCKQCKQYFNIWKRAYWHTKYKHVFKAVVCHICGNEIKNQYRLNQHMIRVHKPPKICCTVEGCTYLAPTNGYLQRHLEHRHSEARNYLCSECGKALKSLKNLKMHLRIHANEKPFKCNLCEYKATQKQSLTWHMKHTHKQC